MNTTILVSKLRLSKNTISFLVAAILGAYSFPKASDLEEKIPSADASTVLAEGSTADEGKEDGNEEGNVSAAEVKSLIKDVNKVLTRNYPGIDTTALIKRIQTRLQWGEKDDRLIEAEGILHWDRGETHLALPCFRRLTDPSPLAMGLMAEALLKKGERYEAAAWFLKAARAYPPKEAVALTMYKHYLEIKSEQGKVVMEYGARLELQQRFTEALDIYSRHQAEIAIDTAATFRVGKLFSKQGMDKDANVLYGLALQTHGENKDLWVLRAQTQERLNQKVESAISWMGAWSLNPSDTSARNRAIAHLESVSPAADTLLKEVLQKGLAKDPFSAPLHFKMATLLLKANERATAYFHLDQALKAAPQNPNYLARLSEAIEGDSLIKVHLKTLKQQSEKNGASTRLTLQVARGSSLSGDKTQACQAWLKANTLSPNSLDGRRDAFLDLAACDEPAAATLAEKLIEKVVPAETDRQIQRAIVQICLRNKSWARASTASIKLVTAFPEDAGIALAVAKNLLAAKDEVKSKEILSAIVQHMPTPEASWLLGKIYFDKKECQPAVEQLALARANYPEAGKMRAECLVQLKDLAGAAAEYENHFTQTSDKESLRAQAHLYSQLGNAPQTKQALEALNAKGWAMEEEKLRLGLMQSASGDTAKAVALFSDLFRSHTTFPSDSLWSKAALILGNHLLLEGKCDKGTKLVTTALKATPNLAAQVLYGRRDTFLGLAACNEPAAQSLAEILGDKIAPNTPDRQALRAIVQIGSHNKSWGHVADASSKLVSAFPEDANIALASAKALLTVKEEPKAKEVLTAIVLHTQSPEASFLLGKIHYANKDCRQAAEQFALARTAYPEVGKMRAACLVELKDFSAAAAEYENHFAHTGDKESLRAQAQIYNKMNSAPQIVQSLETLNAKGWASEDEKLQLGLLQASSGDSAKAMVLFIDLFRTRTAIPPDSLWSTAALLLGNHFLLEGKCDKAIHLISMAQKAASNLTARTLEGRRDTFLGLATCNDPVSQSLAESLGEKVAPNDPDREVLRALVQVSLRNKSWGQLATASKKLVSTFPEDANLALTSAKTLLAAKDEPKGKEVLAAIVLHMPTPEASWLLGKIYFANKDCQHAAEQFGLASANYPDAGKMRAECLVELKDLMGAAAEYENHFAHTSDKESLRAQYRLYTQLANEPQARQALEAINAKGWASEDEKLRLGLMQAVIGDTTKAILLFTDLFRVRTIFPQDSLWPRAALILGNHLLLEGKCEKANKLLSGALKAAPTLAAKTLEGRRDTFLGLAACNDPFAQNLAESLSDKITAIDPDREVQRATVQVSLRNKSWSRASNASIKLVRAFPDDASLVLNTAKSLLAAKEESKAKEVLAAIVLSTPTPEASWLLGKIYFAAKDCRQAAEQFALASAIYPEAGKMRADCLVELKDYQGAAAEYESRHARTGDKESLRAQLRMYLQMGDARQEKETLEALQAKGWTTEAEKLRLGLMQAAAGDSTKAAALFLDLFRARSTFPQDSLWSQAALILGNLSLGQNQCDKAIKYLSISLKSAPTPLPNRADVLMQIGDCNVEKNDWKEAYIAYNEGRSADPKSLPLARGQLQAAKKLNNKTQLAVAYQAIATLDPSDEEAHAFLGLARQNAKDYLQAAYHFRLIADLHPTSAKAWEDLGNALAMIPDLAAAAGPLQSAIDLGAESDEVYINRARAFRVEHSKDMAASILEFLLSRKAQNYLALLWSGKFAEEDGNMQVAREFYKKAAKLTPPNTPWPDLATQVLPQASAVEPQ